MQSPRSMWVKVKRSESCLKVEIFYVKQSMMLIKHMNLVYQLLDDRLALDGSSTWSKIWFTDVFEFLWQIDTGT